MGKTKRGPTVTEEEKDKRRKSFYSDPDMRTSIIELVTKHLRYLDKYPVDESNDEGMTEEEIVEKLMAIEEMNNALERLREVLNQRVWVKITFDMNTKQKEVNP